MTKKKERMGKKKMTADSITVLDSRLAGTRRTAAVPRRGIARSARHTGGANQQRGEVVAAARRHLAKQKIVTSFGFTEFARQAGLQEQLLRESFADVNELLTEALRTVLDEIHVETQVAVQSAAPGVARVIRGVEAHLDAYLKRPELSALNSALRGHDQAQRLRREVDSAYLQMFLSELQPTGIPRQEAQARVLNAMVLEIAAAEHAEGRVMPDIRTALRRHLENL